MRIGAKLAKHAILCYKYSVAAVAELADAHDSKSCGKPCGFESRRRHIIKRGRQAAFFCAPQ